MHNDMQTQELVRDFHLKYGHPVDEKYADIDGELLEFRYALIQEEVNELGEALTNEKLPEIMKELGDIVYTVYGFAETLGIDLDPIMREIHRSNMTKDHNDMDKPIKGNGFSPARIGPLL